MDVIYSIKLTIPLYQVGLLLILSTVVLLFVKAKVALIINYLFLLNWVYWLNRDVLFKRGPSVDSVTLGFFGFGIVIVVLALIGFMNRPE